MSASTSGAAAEHMAAALLSSMGYRVYWPMDPGSPHDLLIEKRGDFLKVQVKRAGWVRNTTGLGEKLRVKTRAGRSGDKARPYQFGDFDLLCAIDGTRMWLIPFEDCRATTQLSLDKRGATNPYKDRKSYDPSRWLVK